MPKLDIKAFRKQIRGTLESRNQVQPTNVKDTINTIKKIKLPRV